MTGCQDHFAEDSNSKDIINDISASSRSYGYTENVAKTVSESDVDFTTREYQEFYESYVQEWTRRRELENTPMTSENMPHIDYVKYEYIIDKQMKEFVEGMNLSQRRAKKRSSSYFDEYDATYVPFYSEWNSSENPERKYWCGHTVLKCVAKKHGSFKTLGDIHYAFTQNSSLYRNDKHCGGGKYCASMADLLWAANNQNNSWWNYNFPSSSVESRYDIESWYQRLKDGVKYNKPAIVASTFAEPVGHFYVITAYFEKRKSNGQLDLKKTIIGLRDVKYTSEGHKYFDRYAQLQEFYDERNGADILFVRP